MTRLIVITCNAFMLGIITAGVILWFAGRTPEQMYRKGVRDTVEKINQHGFTIVKDGKQYALELEDVK